MNSRKFIAAVAVLPLSVVLLAVAGSESHHQDDTTDTTDPDVLAGFV